MSVPSGQYLKEDILVDVSEEAADVEDLHGLKDCADLYLGIDIGRKRDLTIAWLFEKAGTVLWSRYLLVMKGVTFDEQEKRICNLMDLGVRRAGVDASGLGMMLSEHLVQKYGAGVEPVTFTAQIKERLAPLVKQAFEDRTVRIPDNREVRADINSVKRSVTLAGNVRFDAEHTDKGHADRFWALAIVINAATNGVPAASFGSEDNLENRPRRKGLFDSNPARDRAQVGVPLPPQARRHSSVWGFMTGRG